MSRIAMLAVILIDEISCWLYRTRWMIRLTIGSLEMSGHNPDYWSEL